MVDARAKREHRSRSEMLRQIIRDYSMDHQMRDSDVLGGLYELFEPFREATAHMSQQEVYDLIDSAVREVRDEKRGAGHQRAAEGDSAPRRTKREDHAAAR